MREPSLGCASPFQLAGHQHGRGDARPHTDDTPPDGRPEWPSHRGETQRAIEPHSEAVWSARALNQPRLVLAPAPTMPQSGGEKIPALVTSNHTVAAPTAAAGAPTADGFGHPLGAARSATLLDQPDLAKPTPRGRTARPDGAPSPRPTSTPAGAPDGPTYHPENPVAYASTQDRKQGLTNIEASTPWCHAGWALSTTREN